MKIKCNKCEYEWDYGGKLLMATCPCCSTKNKVETKKVIEDARRDIPSLPPL